MSITILRNGEPVTLTGAEADAFEANQQPTLAEAQTDKRTAINQQYVQTLETGVLWNNTRWTATDAARDTLVELHETTQALGQAVTVLDAQNAAHSLSAADLNNLRSAGRVYRHNARENRLALMGQVEAATTVAEVQAIDVTAGWP